jgi:3-hydroxy acid dehydrogenase/malonic semialdehyde reductase
VKHFDGKIVFVTGASAGIGRATAIAFARQGARLLLLARRKERLSDLAEGVRELSGHEARTIAVDLRDSAATVKALDALPAAWKGIDVLVNNAGLARGTAPLHEGHLTDWEEVIDVNVRGLLAVSRTVIPWMLERNRGHVVNLGSIAGHEVYPGGAIYCASKHAVRALSQGMKMDLQGTPLRVTSIDPGLVETEFSSVRFRGDRERAAAPYRGMTPLTAEDIAEAVVWSASRPPHVNIATMVIFPTAQASSTQVYRDSP